MLVVAAVVAVGSAAPVRPLVVIDPGHGGALEGAVGVCGVEEKDVTLAIGLELSRLLVASDRAEVQMTRETDADVSLEDRAAIANRAQADLFVSVHANASTNHEVSGVETYFLSRRAANRRIAQIAGRENEGRPTPGPGRDLPLDQILASLELSAADRESQRLATTVQEGLATSLAASGRGVLQAPFIVLLESRMPAVLVEVGFLTHAEECAALGTVSYQRRIAKSLAVAILQHLARPQRLVLSRRERPVP